MTPVGWRRLAAFARSGVVRLGSLLTLVFLAANVAAFLSAYVLSKQEMENRLRVGLLEEIESLRTIAAADGEEALESEIRARAAAARADGPVYVFWPAGGAEPTIGNARLAEPFVGWRPLDEAAIEPLSPLESADGYLALGTQVAGRPLVLARSTEGRDEVVEIFSQALLVGLAASAALAIAGMLWFLTRTEARIAAIGATLDAVAGGDLERRVPVGTRRDDLGRIARAINEMLDRLCENIAGLHQVSADIAHDLRTPLTRLRATLDRMHDASEFIEDARAQIDVISACFQALLRIAQIEGGSPRARFRPVDLAELCMTVADLFQPSAEDQRRAFRVEIAADTPLVVEGDRDLLAQMLSNLLENALRHAPPPAGVTLSLAQRGAAAEITVADAGPGIPQEEREKVFRRLYRLEASRTTEGSGLGLSLVAAVVGLHRGVISLDDNAPGLRATVALPLLGAAEGERDQRAAVRPSNRAHMAAPTSNQMPPTR